jgi:hypothetical protein
MELTFTALSMIAFFFAFLFWLHCLFWFFFYRWVSPSGEWLDFENKKPMPFYDVFRNVYKRDELFYKQKGKMSEKL